MPANFKSFVTIALIASGLGLVSCSKSPESSASNTVVASEKSGPWTLNRDDSGMTFITTKNSAVSEIGTFTALDGKVTKDGAAKFTIVVDSINTNNEIRDPRMRQYLFKTDQNPYISVSANLDLAAYADMTIGERRTTLLAYDLDMNGMSNAKESYVMVTRLGPNRVLVENKAPVIIDATDFGLDTGVEKLRGLANLESITPVVPVTFSLVFER